MKRAPQFYGLIVPWSFYPRLLMLAITNPRLAKGIILQLLHESTDGESILRDDSSRIGLDKNQGLKIYCRKIRGFYICLDPSDFGICYSISTRGWYEWETTVLLSKLLKKGSLFVDVGANIGWFTLLGASKVGENGKVYAFEPDPASFRLLRASLHLNRMHQVWSSQCCLAETQGLRLIHISPTSNKGMHSIVAKLGGPDVLVSATTLDAFAKENCLAKIDVMKIDVEEAEPLVIEGMLGAIREHIVGRIVMEWSPRAWIEKPRLLEFLFAHFHVYQIVRKAGMVLLSRLYIKSMPDERCNILLEAKIVNSR